ncbi:MAG TPA: PA14 domain-containing protein, partial [Fimbriimonadaceae bacterium]|nr:PA14 domain-containing protein [Fimbriimonadaceae bacterium]
IEATFSRNVFVNNLCAECDYGIWGGYSYDTDTRDNVITGCRVAAAFEHSQRCMFYGNNLVHDKTGIQLWGGGKPDPNWGYAKKKDVRSLENTITQNAFHDVQGPCVWLRQSESAHVVKNLADGLTKGIDSDGSGKPFDETSLTPLGGNPLVEPVQWGNEREYPADIPTLVTDWWNPFDPRRNPKPKQLAGGLNPFVTPAARRGRRYILVDEWGPFDFRYPRLWPRGEVASRTTQFEVLGPKGQWKVVSVKGGTVVGPKAGRTPGFVTLTMPAGAATDVKLTLEYTGAEVTDYRGITTPAGKPVTFSFSQFFAPIDWNIEFFKWDKDTDPRKDEHAFSVLLAGPPIATAKSSKLDYSGYGEWAPGVPSDYFAISATGDFTIGAGNYTLDLTTDDGARIFLDGKPLQLYDSDGKAASAFHYQGPTGYTAPLTLAKGKHRLYVEYFQIDGYRTLQVRLKKR